MSDGDGLANAIAPAVPETPVDQLHMGKAAISQQATPSALGDHAIRLFENLLIDLEADSRAMAGVDPPGDGDGALAVAEAKADEPGAVTQRRGVEREPGGATIPTRQMGLQDGIVEPMRIHRAGQEPFHAPDAGIHRLGRVESKGLACNAGILFQDQPGDGPGQRAQAPKILPRSRLTEVAEYRMMCQPSDAHEVIVPQGSLLCNVTRRQS